MVSMAKLEDFIIAKPLILKKYVSIKINNLYRYLECHLMDRYEIIEIVLIFSPVNMAFSILAFLVSEVFIVVFIVRKVSSLHECYSYPGEFQWIQQFSH